MRHSFGHHIDFRGTSSRLVASLISALAFTSVQATTVTFDDLSTTGLGFAGVGFMPSSYSGLNFSCIQLCTIVDGSTYGGNPSGYMGAVISGANVLATNSPLTISLSDGGLFVFDGAYLTGAWRDGLMVSFTGFNGSAVMQSTTLILGTAGSSSLYSFGWSGVTAVQISPSGGTASEGFTYASLPSVAIDDLVYSKAAVPGIPEPSTYALMLAGLAAAAFSTRRRSARKGQR